jgi:hypothetical protein
VALMVVVNVMVVMNVMVYIHDYGMIISNWS